MVSSINIYPIQVYNIVWIANLDCSCGASSALSCRLSYVYLIFMFISQCLSICLPVFHLLGYVEVFGKLQRNHGNFYPFPWNMESSVSFYYHTGLVFIIVVVCVYQCISTSPLWSSLFRNSSNHFLNLIIGAYTVCNNLWLQKHVLLSIPLMN